MENEIEEMKEKIVITEEKIRKVEIDINDYTLKNTNWAAVAFTDYFSFLLKDKSDLMQEKKGLMQKESDLRNEIISLRDNATPQGKTIINHQK